MWLFLCLCVCLSVRDHCEQELAERKLDEAEERNIKICLDKNYRVGDSEKEMS